MPLTRRVEAGVVASGRRCKSRKNIMPDRATANDTDRHLQSNICKATDLGGHAEGLEVVQRRGGDRHPGRFRQALLRPPVERARVAVGVAELRFALEQDCDVDAERRGTANDRGSSDDIKQPTVDLCGNNAPLLQVGAGPNSYAKVGSGADRRHVRSRKVARAKLLVALLATSRHDDAAFA